MSRLQVGRRSASIVAAFLVALPAVAIASPAAHAETLPGLAVGGVRVVESPAGQSVVQVPVVLDRPAAAAVTFTWSVASGGTDTVVPAVGSGTVAAGAQSTTIPVTIKADSDWNQWDEAGTVTLTGVTGAVIERATGLVKVRDAYSFDSVPPISVWVGDLTIPEPDIGSVTFPVPVTVYGAFRQPITVSWEMRSQYGAVVGVDGGPASGTFTVPRLTPTASFPITVNGDTAAEPQETLLVKPLSASGPKGTGIADRWGEIRIPIDDSGTDSLPWTAPAAVLAGPATTFYTESDLGSWVGGGESWHFTKANAGFRLDDSPTMLTLNVDGDDDATLRMFRPTATGTWTRQDQQSFDVSADAAACNTSTATVVIDRVVRADDGSLTALTLRYEQACDEDPEHVTRGFVRYDRSDPTMPPPPGDPSQLTWYPPSGAVPTSGSYLYTVSSAGEWLGQGTTQLLTPGTSSWQTTATEPGGIVVWVVRPDTTYWWAAIGMPQWQGVFTRGLYPFGSGALANPTKATLNLATDGRGCNAMYGQLAVDAAEVDATGLKQVELRFEAYCDDIAAPLRGAFRWVRP